MWYVFYEILLHKVDGRLLSAQVLLVRRERLHIRHGARRERASHWSANRGRLPRQGHRPWRRQSVYNCCPSWHDYYHLPAG